MTLLWDAVGGAVLVAGGFLAGCRYTSRHLHEILARATPDQLRLLARRTAEQRK
jgi:hypothetical protein